MSDKSNKYGYVGVDIPAQSFGSNKGVFNPAEINDLVANNQWTTFGQLELIETKIASADSQIIFNDIKESTYNVHFLTVTNYTASADGIDLGIRFFENGVEETASVYQYAYQYGSSGVVGFGESKLTSVDRLLASASTGNQANEVGNSYNYFYNLGNSSKYSFQTVQSTNIRLDSSYIMTFGSGVLPQASTVNQIKLYTYSGTFSATASLYGIRYS